MGNTPPEAQQSQDKFIAAAFSAALNYPVVTEVEYTQRRHEPLFQNAQTLDLDKITSMIYEPAKGKFGNVFGESGKKIRVSLVTPSGRKFILQVGNDSYVEELKYLLEESEGVPVDYDRIKFLYKGVTMKDQKRLSYYDVS